jgi:hypothetical protein
MRSIDKSRITTSQKMELKNKYNEYYIKKYNLPAKKLEEHLLNNFDKDLIDIKGII